MQLIPQRHFTVVRQIADHLDTATYYVRAVVRDANTDELLATLDLDDKGGQRFSKMWRVVADPSGLGRYISIVTSVYTDSGYTTKSGNYGDEENTYLVKDHVRNGGGGGISAGDVRQIFQQELKKIEFPEQKEIKIPKPEKVETRADEVLAGIDEVKAMVAEIPKDPQDFQWLENAINQVLFSIEAKEVTPETDLAPLLERLAEQRDEILQTVSEIRDEMKQALVEQDEKVGGRVQQSIQDNFNKASFSIPLNAAQIQKQEEVSRPEDPPFDIKQFTK